VTPAEWDTLTAEQRGPCQDCEGPLHNGYGRGSWQGRKMNASRAAWFNAHGPLPSKIYVLHHCDNRACLNLNHLYAGSPGDNARDRDRRKRGPQSRKTHCPQGHVLVDLPYKFADSSKRWCPVCRADQAERYRETHGEQIKARQRNHKRALYEADPEKYRERARRYYQARVARER